MTPVSYAPDELSAAWDAWCGERTVNHVIGERYFELMSYRYQLINVGTGLLSLGLSGVCLARRFAATTLSAATTPTTRLVFFGYGLLALFVITLAELLSLGVDLGRKLFPWCADSTAIPMAGLLSSFLIVATLCTVVGLMLSLGFGRLPAPLFTWDNTKPIKSSLVSLVFVGIAAVGIMLLILSLQSSAAWAGPAYIVLAYLSLSTRAALLAPRASAADR